MLFFFSKWNFYYFLSWYGKHYFLSKGCTEGWYGLDCKQQCSGHCRDNAVCNHVTGGCNVGCTAGWTGTLCNKGVSRWNIWINFWLQRPILVIAIILINYAFGIKVLQINITNIVYFRFWYYHYYSWFRQTPYSVCLQIILGFVLKLSFLKPEFWTRVFRQIQCFQRSQIQTSVILFRALATFINSYVCQKFWIWYWFQFVG